MTQRGISVLNLAESTHIPRTTLSRRLSGASPFRLNELALIADVLDTSVVQILAAAEVVAA